MFNNLKKYNASDANLLFRMLASRSKRRIHSSRPSKRCIIREPITVCCNIPNVDLYENDPNTIVNIRELCGGRRVVIFGVPGAFTSVCSKAHLPGFVKKADEFKKMGIHEIVCVSVNDPFVMKAWGLAHHANGKVRLLADTRGCFTNAIGLGMDLPQLGGFRSQRYSMVVDNAIVMSINIECDSSKLTVSSAENLKV